MGEFILKSQETKTSLGQKDSNILIRPISTNAKKED